ncbi:hypothetical protein [Falsiroseomonas sp. HW251]|uniref:hypothetical protein n=1 Tax=Falsiroseomonas sp. HW251 TaxID=3390998 RepID=UPI003D324117
MLPAAAVGSPNRGRVKAVLGYVFAQSIRSIAASIGILPDRPARRARAVVERCTLVNNTRGGLFEAFIGPGAIVAKDQAIGRVVALDGREVEVIRSPVGPAYIAAIRKTWSAVTSGEMVAECNEFVASWRGRHRRRRRDERGHGPRRAVRSASARLGSCQTALDRPGRKRSHETFLRRRLARIAPA